MSHRDPVLMGPGPCNVDPRVMLAMAKPLLGHLDPDFIRIMHQVQDLLRNVFATRNSLTIPISGTGTAGMEAAFVNVVEPGDTLSAIAKRFGTSVAAIVAANDIADADRIIVGQRLLIPEAKEPLPAPKAATGERPGVWERLTPDSRAANSKV